MRLKLTMLKTSKEDSFNINYNYHIFKAFSNAMNYYNLRTVDLENTPDNSSLPYTFSNLIVPKRQIENDTLQLKSKVVYIYFSSVDENIVRSIMSYFSLYPQFSIEKVSFEVIAMQIIKTSAFQHNREYKFTALSPITLCADSDKNKQLDVKNFKHLSKLVEKNLVTRYENYHKKQLNDVYLSFSIDEEYLMRKNYQVHKKIAILDGDKVIENICCVFAPFSVIGNPELLEFGYYSGFGYKTYVGFGMGEIVP